MFKGLRLSSPLAFIDIESTGLDPRTDRAVEIAALRFSPDGARDSFAQRVNPGVPIPPSATAVHGIADGDVRDCRPFGEIARNLSLFLERCDLAGFGIKKFDLPLLLAEYGRVGVPFPLSGRAVIDVLQIYHSRERRDLRAAFAFYCGKQLVHAHRAEQDAWATAMILDAQLQRYRDLPDSVRDLHQQLTEVDLAAHFRLEGSEPVFCQGRHLGRLLKDVACDDPGYLEWMLFGDFNDDVKELVRQAMRSPSEGG
jgi:DNA polymerase-3 subunit epsilon